MPPFDVFVSAVANSRYKHDPSWCDSLTHSDGWQNANRTQIGATVVTGGICAAYLRAAEYVSTSTTKAVTPPATSPAISDPGRLLLSKDDAAIALAISVRTVHAMILDGRLSSIKIGTRRLIPRASLLAFVNANTETTGGAA